MLQTGSNSSNISLNLWERFVLVLLFLIFLIRMLIMWIPGFTDSVYTQYIFMSLTFGWDNVLKFVTIPLIYVWWLVIIFIVLWFASKVYFNRWSYKVFMVKCSFLFFFHLAWFYLFWGFNYHQNSLRKQLSWKNHFDTQELIHETEAITFELINLRAKISKDIPEKQNFIKTLPAIKHDLEKVFKGFDLTTRQDAKVKLLYPEGSLLKMGTMGFYWPICSEAYIDPGIHALQISLTYAHELSHAFGRTDEGECNFLAYLACEKSPNDWVQYSAKLNYWSHLMRDLYAVDRSCHRILNDFMHADVKDDLFQIKKNGKRFKEFFPEVRNYLYSFYLKSHGISSGLKSYSEVTLWILNFKKEGYF